MLPAAAAAAKTGLLAHPPNHLRNHSAFFYVACLEWKSREFLVEAEGFFVALPSRISNLDEKKPIYRLDVLFRQFPGQNGL